MPSSSASKSKPSKKSAASKSSAKSASARKSKSSSAGESSSSSGEAYKKNSRCWPGYVPVPGKGEHEEGSCRKAPASKNAGVSVNRETARKKQIARGGDRAQQARSKSPDPAERRSVSKAAKPGKSSAAKASSKTSKSSTKAATRKSPAKKSAAKKSTAKKAPASKSAARKSTARKAA